MVGNGPPGLMLEGPPVAGESGCRFEAHAARGLRWLSGNLDRFSPIDKTGGAPEITPFAELAILFERLHSSKYAPFAERLGLSGHLPRWGRFIARQLNDRAYAELPRRMPAGSYNLLLPYLMLRATGYRRAFHEESLRRMTERGDGRFIELVPYRIVDREYFLWRAGVAAEEPDWARLYAETLLARIPNALHVDKEGTYAITHTLFYLTDWGRRPPPFDPEELDRVSHIVDCLAVHYWRMRHWDLLGELLLARAGLGPGESRLLSEACAAFLGAWRPEGYVLGEGVEVPGLRESPQTAHAQIIFGECYHTTLVAILFCIAVLDRRSAAP
jgi:uncharacterized protein DUF6895